MYMPTMSLSFSINCGSRETLKTRTRCGFNPCWRHTRSTVVSLTPTNCAASILTGRPPRGNRLVVQSIRSAQHDLRTAGQSDADRLGSRPLRQLRTLFTQEHAYRRYTHRLIPTDGPNGRTINDRISSAKYEALH